MASGGLLLRLCLFDFFWWMKVVHKSFENEFALKPDRCDAHDPEPSSETLRREDSLHQSTFEPTGHPDAAENANADYGIDSDKTAERGQMPKQIVDRRRLIGFLALDSTPLDQIVSTMQTNP